MLCENTVLTVDNRGQDLVTDAGKKRTAIPRVEESFITRYPEAYQNELDHFLNVIQGWFVCIVFDTAFQHDQLWVFFSALSPLRPEC